MELTDWLSDVSVADLLRMHRALVSGRLALDGISEARLAYRHLPRTWAAPLALLGERGWTAETLAQAIIWGLSERERSEQRRPRVVSTQPGVAEPGFVNTPVVLRRLFQQARREVLLAGFRVTDRGILEHLRRPEATRLDIRLFVDVDPSTDATGWKRARRLEASACPSIWWAEFMDEVWPEAMDPPQAWYSPLTLSRGDDGWLSMHIKTAVVDRRHWLVTSANFTDRGQRRNFELGLLIDDEKAAEAVISHFERMARDGIFVGFEQG